MLRLSLWSLRDPEFHFVHRMTLYRARNGLIGGVCGGLAVALGWTPTRVRILYVLVSVLSAAFPGIIVYLILWVVIPKSPR